MIESNVITKTYTTLIDEYFINCLNILIYKNSTITKQIVNIPTQIGCMNSCSFCISGKSNFVRNLKLHELKQLIDSVPFFCSNVELSFTGEGEPLHNIKVLNQILTDKHYCSKFSGTKISFSGLGSNLLGKIKSDIPLTIQFSLHHTDNQKRQEVIPRTDSLEVIRQNLIKYSNKFKQIQVNYILIDGVNDSIENLKSAKDFINGTNWKFMLNQIMIEDLNKVKKIDFSKIKEIGIYPKLKVGNSVMKNNLYSLLTNKKCF